jgi:hypothetical protein
MVKTDSGITSTGSKIAGSIVADVYIADFEKRISSGSLSTGEQTVVLDAIRKIKVLQKSGAEVADVIKAYTTVCNDLSNAKTSVSAQDKPAKDSPTVLGYINNLGNDIVSLGRTLYQEYVKRSNNALRSVPDFLNMLTLGIFEGVYRTSKDTTERMLADPSVRNVANWLTLGHVDMFETATTFDYDHPLSQWIASTGLATELFGIYTVLGGTSVVNPSGLGDALSPNLPTYGFDKPYVEESFDDFVDISNGIGKTIDDFTDSGLAFKYFDNSQLKTQHDSAFFWSGRTNGVGGMDVAADIAFQRGGITLEQLIESQGINMPVYDVNIPSSIVAWEQASKVYAAQASGEIRAIIGSSVRDLSVWNTIELPTLINNKDVVKIIVIDPSTLVETVIFER